MKNQIPYSKWQAFALVVLRIVIGWHFLYEGVYKLLKPTWTSKFYLEDSGGFLSELFKSIAENDTLLSIANTATVWGLILIGLSLILGCLSKYFSFAGMALLLMFYLSHIPLVGSEYLLPTEGNYLWIDRNLIEIFALLVLIVFPSSHIIGLDRLFINRKKN